MLLCLIFILFFFILCVKYVLFYINSLGVLNLLGGISIFKMSVFFYCLIFNYNVINEIY